MRSGTSALSEIIVVNTGDKSGNGVPDFADGCGLDRSGLALHTGTLLSATGQGVLPGQLSRLRRAMNG
jgi:hypothetical protein